MKIPGKDFNSENTSIVTWSNNVAFCLRTATFIRQGLLNYTELKQEITENKLPNTLVIAEKIIPNFISNDIRGKLKDYVANETAIALDDDIMKLNNTKVS